MGIPGFASRLRDHGSVTALGRQGEPRGDRAIIDGPSLAHSLLQHVSEDLPENKDGIGPRHRYATIGKAAIAWLDDLTQHGFEIEAVYFDGALPEHKKDTRLERLQAYVDKLLVFKAAHDDLTKAMKNLRSQVSPEHVRRRLNEARKKLPPPPFLVFAILDALRRSSYANRTHTVNGEADDFCAAEALAVSQQAGVLQTTIFTNDSDLVVYGLADTTRVVQISEMSTRLDGHEPVLMGLEFWPAQLRALGPDQEMTDLIQPAYLMKCDPHLSFLKALRGTHGNDVNFSAAPFRSFAESYDLGNALGDVADLRQSMCAGNYPFGRLDSRVSELLRKIVFERDRIRRTKEWYATADARELEQREADLANGWNCMRGAAREGSVTNMSSTEGEDRANGVDTRDFAYDPEEEDLKPVDMDLYLPVLIEDPSRSTAWKIGTSIRGLAVSIATALCSTSTTVYEYKRSGQRIRGTACQKIPTAACGEWLESWTKAWQDPAQHPPSLREEQRWEIVIVQHLLADMAEAEMTLPTKEAILTVVTGGTISTWDMLHLDAQFQAEYYSLRMLKQVLNVVSQCEGKDGLYRKSIEQALQALDTFPSIPDFFEHAVLDEGTQQGFEAAVERCLEECGISAASETALKSPKHKEKATTSKQSQKERKGGKSAPRGQAGNAFAFLDDGEEV